MNKYIISLLFILQIGCSPKPMSPAEIVATYYTAFNNSNFSQLAPLLSNSLIVAEGDYITPYSIDGYYEHFRWDSVFQTTYEIVNIEEQQNKVTVTISSSSERYKFLKNDPLICPNKFTIENHKISRIDVLECENADWPVWQQERDSLVSWIRQNHPELDGFIHDLTVKGAVNYKKAMQLYQQ